MNLFLGILCLAGAIGLFAYEFATGERLLSIRALNISSAWFLLLLAVYNLVRWYSVRAWQEDERALRIAQEARLRQARHRERGEPDPTFDFSDRPSGGQDRPPDGS